MVLGNTLPRMNYSTLTVFVLCLFGGWRSDAACPGSDWKTYGEWCYLFQGGNNDYTSWTDAAATCLQHQSTLVSIHSEGENDFIVQEMLAEKPIRFNIGLKKINEGYEWADLSALDYLNWFGGQPNDGNGDYMCAQIHPSDSSAWILGRCDFDSAYVCKVGINSNPTPSPPERSCPSAEWDDFGESCFYYEAYGYSDWDYANDMCIQKGGNLAVINDQSEMDRIHQKMTEAGVWMDYWIGLRVNDGAYDNWIDGTPVEYEHFMDGEPNGQPGENLCAKAMAYTGEWDDTFCYDYGSYVCSAQKIVVGGWQEFNGKTYYHSHTDEQNSFSWYSARTFCNMEGGELASVHTQDEMDFIVNLMNVAGFSGNFWIGLNMIQQDTYTWTDGSDTNYTNEDDTQPDDGLIQNDCVTAKMDTSGTWVKTNCAKPSGFMCKKHTGSVYPIEPAPTPETAGFCPSGYIDMGSSNKCFKLVYEHAGVDWETAVAVCRQEPGLYPDIASITTAQEDAWITTQLQSYTTGLWIGLKLEDNNWVWADSADYSFQNWAPTQPAEEPDMCADVSYIPAGTWRKTKCDQKRGYICETYKDPNNYIPTRGVTPSHDCIKGYHPNGEGCYKLVPELMSWADAKTNCEKDGANYYLVTMDSAAENAVAALFSEHASQVLWGGMYKDMDTGEWKWVNDWYVMYTNWETGYPREHDESNCMIIDSRAKWINVNCDVKFASLCKTTTAIPITPPTHIDGTCPDGDDWEAFGSHCYYFSNSIINWKDSLTDCLRQSATLVSIHNDAENKFVTDEANSRFGGHTVNTWIGFYKSAIDSSWHWQDGSAVQFTKWVDDRPPAEEDIKCTSLNIDGSMQTYWTGGDCDTFGYYICKMPKLPPTTLPPTLNWICPNNQWDELEETCFKYYPNSLKTWSTAATNCTAQGGHLATIETLTQNIHIYTMMEETAHMKGFDYWIGLSKKDKDSNYEWLDGSDLGYTAWAPGEPNDDQGIENCVQVMAADGLTMTWDDHDCEKATNGFVCETAKVPKPDSGGLSAGAIVGIVFGVLIGVGLIGALVFALVYRSRNTPPPSGPNRQQGIDNPTMSTGDAYNHFQKEEEA